MSYVSSCVLDGIAATLWVDVELVRPILRPWARPAPVSTRFRGKHPVLVEAWVVKEGRIEAGAADIALDPAAWWRGWTGWFQAGARAALPWARAASYDEVAVTIPARLAGDPGGETFAYVAAMYTDSPVAIWGDQTMRCGYRKRLARIFRPSPGALRVETPDGAPLVSLDLTVAGGKDLGRGTAGSLLDARLALPYLGGLEDRRFATSVMERSAGAGSIVAAPVVGRIDCAPGFADALPALSAQVRPFSARDRWGALAFAGIRARLEGPRHGQV